jgi:three-Cys-motif partner protein
MSPKNFHQRFDKGTQTKLHIFNEYFKESFPVFLFTPFWNEILIYDFFAGKGYDEFGEKSTSLNILEQIKPHCQTLIDKNKRLYILLNDKDCKKELEHNVNEYLVECQRDCNTKCIIREGLKITDQDFAVYFDNIYEKIKSRKNSAKLIFLDPFNFILDNEKFRKLISLKSCDFICFLPSSYLRRFKEYNGFNSFIDTRTIDYDSSIPAHCHRLIAEYFETLLPIGKEYYIGSFSIKKGRNYYGVIFGSNHTLGAEKFQKVCWSLDGITGEADYDIDREPSYNTSDGLLFEEFKIPLKIKNFKQALVNKIITRQVKTDIGAYKFALSRRCMVKHASEVLKEMQSTNQIAKFKVILSDIHKYKQPIEIQLL